MARRILVLNGPNLNLLGRREPTIYGRTTLADIEAACRATADELALALSFRQSNAEGELVGWVQEALADDVAGLVVNAAAYSHSSIALMDALKAVDKPTVEVHLSNVFRREPFRAHSYVSLAATGVICGLGVHGYTLALRALATMLAERPAP